MRSFEPRTSKPISNSQDFHKKYINHILQSKLLTLTISHKILDCFNLSLFFLIIIFSFIAINSQREWTEIYSSIIKMRLINNDLNEYISKTEDYFLHEVDMKDQFKKATSKDLIYLKKPLEKFNHKFFFSDFLNGLNDGKYQRGY
tara:strand:- start:446 stop:880 length:435 start_codon:yes stop_codon:yes gene_type:complete